MTAGRTAMSASRRVGLNNELAMVSSIVISGCGPAAGSWQRYRAPPWLSFLGGERHKMFSRWLFHPSLAVRRGPRAD
mgnify:CR=1 FL=1